MVRLTLNKVDLINLLYAVFIISGVIKSVLHYIGVPKVFDLTAITLFLILLDMFYVLVAKKHRLPKISRQQMEYLMLIFAFQAVVFVSLIYSVSPSFGYYKSLLLGLNIVAFCYPIFRPCVSMESFISIIYKFIIPFSIFIIFLNLVRWTPYRYLIDVVKADEIRGHYLTIGMFLGLIALFYILFREQLKPKLFPKIMLPIFLLIVSSARGPLIFFMLVLGLTYFFRLKQIRFKMKKWNLLILFLVLAFIFITPLRDSFLNLFGRTLDRFYAMFFETDGGKSIIERVDFLKYSFEKIFNNPVTFLFGYGIGSFMFLYNGVDGRGYPHNILVESLFELGLIGLVILGVFIFLILFYKTKKKSSKLLLIFLLLCYSKSGGLEDIRIIYGIYSLYLACLFVPKMIRI